MSTYRVCPPLVFALAVATAWPAGAEETRKAWSLLGSRDCPSTPLCHVVFDKVPENHRLELQTVTCVQTVTSEGDRITFAALYVSGKDPSVTKALYAVSPRQIGGNGTTWYWGFNQQGFMPVLSGQTPRVETYRQSGIGPFTNVCTISGHMVKVK